METSKSTTRLERPTRRQRRFVSAKEARLAARLARLDLKVSGETGALRGRTKHRSQLDSRIHGGDPATTGLGTTTANLPWSFYLQAREAPVKGGTSCGYTAS